MKEGYLSQYFINVAAKRLSKVEADPQISHQHEFNGTRELKKVLGAGTTEKIQFPAIFLWIGQDNEAISSEGTVTWYDARRDHPTRSEYRLYFPTTYISEMSQAGDMIFIARRRNDTLMIILAEAGSTIENQLLWLFGLSGNTNTEFSSQEIKNEDDKEVDFVVRFILDELGIDVEEPEADYLDHLLMPFNGTIPQSKDFSAYTRTTITNVNVLDAPDDAFMTWLDHEEKLFRRLERHIVDRRLQEGFSDTDENQNRGFLNFSQSVQSTRKSRTALALENHLEEIFSINNIAFSRPPQSEIDPKADFIFPSITSYHDTRYPCNLLTMLGVKTSCRHSWREALAQADRIAGKHLFTLEPGITGYTN